MKRRKRFLIPLLMAIVMMAMSPQSVWAQDVYISHIKMGANTDNSNHVNVSGIICTSVVETPLDNSHIHRSKTECYSREGRFNRGDDAATEMFEWLEE